MTGRKPVGAESDGAEPSEPKAALAAETRCGFAGSANATMSSPGRNPPFAHRPWLLALVLVIVTVLAYQSAWHAGFIWDDDSYVTENQDLRSLEGLGRIWAQPGTATQYYPLALTTFWAEYHLWKLQPLGYHLANILLHAVNAVLLWRVLRRLGVPGSWWAAMLWVLHPVCVESVAWVTERKNVLSGLFYFLAVLAYLRFRPLTDREAARTCDWRYYPLVLVLFLCALLSKTVTCSLPAVLLLLVWWKTGRVGRRDILALAPLFVMGVASGFVTTWMEKQYVGASGAEWALSFVQRCLVAGRALWFYAGKLFWPGNFTFIYPRWEIDADAAWQYLFPVAALVVLIALWWLRSRIGRGPLVAVLCFAGTLVPALGFFDVFPFRYSYVADHFQYLACIGLISLAVGTVTAICDRAGQRVRDWGALAAAIVSLVLGVSTWRQARMYQNLETLWRDTLTKNPRCWLAHNNLGNAFLQEGKISEAVGHCEQALRIKPDYAEPHYNLAIALEKLGRAREAIEHYQQALRIEPDYAEAHNNLAIALEKLGRAPEAIEHYQQALRINPDYAEARNNLGFALQQAGRTREAITDYEQALRIKPDLAVAHINLGNVLAKLGKDPEAIGHYEQALEIEPRSAEVHYDLANALLRVGNAAQAITHYGQSLEINPRNAEAHSKLGIALIATGNTHDALGQWEQALRINPDLTEAQNNLAWMLATLPPAQGGNPIRAVSLAQQACEITGNRAPGDLDTLAVAYAAAGRFDDAIATARKAIDLARPAGQAELVKEIQARLELYRSGRTYSPPAAATSPDSP